MILCKVSIKSGFPKQFNLARKSFSKDKIPFLALNVEKLIVVFVVGAANAVVPLPAAVFLVPVAGDQMAEPLVAEGRKGEHVPGAALLRSASSHDQRVNLFIFTRHAAIPPFQPFFSAGRRKTQLKS